MDELTTKACPDHGFEVPPHQYVDFAVGSKLTGFTTREYTCPGRPAPDTRKWILADDVDRLVRELDEAWNGKDGMARQASLCDIVGQIIHERRAPDTRVPESVREVLGWSIAAHNASCRCATDDWTCTQIKGARAFLSDTETPK